MKHLQRLCVANALPYFPQPQLPENKGPFSHRRLHSRVKCVKVRCSGLHRSLCSVSHAFHRCWLNLDSATVIVVPLTRHLIVTELSAKDAQCCLSAYQVVCLTQPSH